jgi:multidrug efflux pump subunit AcrA (membrane-fusion protein)
VLTEAQVNEGTLIRAGQRLGEFIDPSIYEVEVAVNKSFAPYLKAGEEVELANMENTASWKGKVSRVNGKIDQATQTITAYVEVTAPEIKEGMYLQANIHARDVDDAYQIERSLLVDRSRVFAVKDTVLELLPVKPVFYSEKHVIVKGLKDGAMVLSKAVPGAYPGMVIKVADADLNTVAQ